MAHTDPEILAMMAMGEAALTADLDAVAACPTCAAELASLCRVADLARSGPKEDAFAAPSPVVWARISGQLGFAADVLPEPFPEAAPSPQAPAGSRTSLRQNRAPARRRRFVGRPTLIAASALLVMGGVAAAVVVVQERSAPTVLATVALDPLPDWTGASGEATVELNRDGRRDLVLNVSVPERSTGFREVWLISTDFTELVSLGVLDGTTSTFAIPAEVDLADFPVVDVSQEAVDGDPTHSGDSIVRGALG